MANKVKIKDEQGSQVFPITHVSAVLDNNGDNIGEIVSGKQDELVSGSNIKTINGQSLLGSGNITIQGGSGGDEQLVAAGYTEYVAPEPTPAELLERAKQQKIAELEGYDNSDAVNQFFLGEYPLWLDFDERERLKAQIESRLRLSYQTMTKTYGGLPAVTFSLSVWQVMSDQLEAYAGDCQEVTNGHKAAILLLQSVQEVEAYDFTVGYPERLRFEV